MLLEIEDLWVKYGRAEALRGVSLNVRESGEVIAVIGSNGAGKTTLLRAVSGLTRPSAGVMRFEDKPFFDAHRHTPAYDIVKLGIAHVPAGRMVFADMTVMDNLKMGSYLVRSRADQESALEAIFGHFPILKERKGQIAGSLSGGQQQMVAIARALMARPKLLLMDEPSIGLSPLMVQEVAKIVAEINLMGVGVVLVEQNARLALKLADRAYLLDTGRVTLQGAASDLANDRRVQDAYLGGV